MYVTGKISIGGVTSQDVTVPRGSYMHDLLDGGPVAAGKEIVELARNYELLGADFQAELRRCLLPDELSEPDRSSCSERKSGSDLGSEYGSD